MIVVDTSVATKWVIPEDMDIREPHTDVALALLEQGLIAPDLILAEFGNALWKKIGNGEIGVVQATEAIRVLPSIVSLVPMAAYVERAFEIAIALDHPVHDCFFLAVAEEHSSRLVTADRRLVKRCAPTRYATWIVDLASEA